VENESGFDYEEFVNFTTKNCELDRLDDDAAAKNFYLKPKELKLTVLKRVDMESRFCVGFKFKYKLFKD
jgi:hypothetical protein